MCDLIAKYDAGFLYFQETKRELLSDGFLKALACKIDYVWHFLRANNTVGGILGGLKNSVVEVVGFTNT